jgi:hypothetical protein
VWVREKQGKALRLEPRNSSAQETARALEERKRRFIAGIEKLVQGLSLDEAGLLRLNESDPASASLLAHAGARQAIQFTTLLDRRRWTQLASKGRLSLYADEIGPEGFNLVRQFAGHLNNIASPPGAADPSQPPLIDPKRIGHGPLVFEIRPDQSGQPYGFLAIGMRGDSGFASITLSGDQQPATRWNDTGKPKDDTAAKRSLQFARPPADWGEALRAAAEALDINVLSEDYTRPSARPTFQLLGQLSGTTPELLDRLCGVFGYQWRLKDGVHQFRSAAWYVDRQQEPPGTLVKAAATARKEGRRLTLAWLAAAAALHPDRQPRLWRHAPEAAAVVEKSRGVLRFYDALTPAQRAVLETDGGLPAQRLERRQREELLSFLMSTGLSRQTAAVSAVMVKLVQTPEVARFTFFTSARSVEATVELPQPGRVRTPGAP